MPKCCACENIFVHDEARDDWMWAFFPDYSYQDTCNYCMIGICDRKIKMWNKSKMLLEKLTKENEKIDA